MAFVSGLALSFFPSLWLLAYTTIPSPPTPTLSRLPIYYTHLFPFTHDPLHSCPSLPPPSLHWLRRDLHGGCPGGSLGSPAASSVRRRRVHGRVHGDLACMRGVSRSPCVSSSSSPSLAVPLSWFTVTCRARRTAPRPRWLPSPRPTRWPFGTGSLSSRTRPDGSPPSTPSS